MFGNPPPMRSVLPVFVAGSLFASCASAPEPVVPDRRGEAARLLAEERFDAAALVLEEHLDREPDDAEAWRMLATTLVRLVDEGGGHPLALEDARAAWTRALELDPRDPDAVRGAADIALRFGSYGEARDLAQRGLEGAIDRGETPAPGLLELACRARTGLLRTTDPADEEAWANALRSARDTLAESRRLAPDEIGLALLQAQFLDDLGLPDLAVEVLEAEVERRPDQAVLHQRLIDSLYRAGALERLFAFYDGQVRDSSNGSESPTLIWYAGYVTRLAGDQALRERDFDAARTAYQDACRRMRQSVEREPSFRSSAEQICLQAEVSTIWSRLDERDLAAAEAELLDFFAKHPEALDLVDGLNRSARNAAAFLGERLIALNQFARAASLARAVVAVASDDGQWWNNLGFILREYGSQAASGALSEVADPGSRALSIWRESWEAYLRAVELKPEDARVINDTALIQVYHLRDDLPRAEELLHRAIEVGEAELAALGPNPPERERFPLAQAVGDAYENLGYLYYHVYRKPAESREFWVKSMATDSGDRSQSQAYLDSIDGTGESVAERPASIGINPPQEEEEPASIPWESSLADARRIAGEEKRPLLVYQRGQGLGLAIEFLDSFVTTAEFCERSGGAVLLVADALRHNFVDRRRDGTRLVCSKWGSLTCAEHGAAAAEFSSWFESSSGAPAGESEEGVWLQKPDQTELAPLAGLRTLREDLQLAEASAPRADWDELADLAGRAEAPEAARSLVALPHRAARDRVEAIVFGGASLEKCRALIEALAAEGSPRAQEMLAACVTQPRDGALALLALGSWPEGFDLAPVRYAALWSDSDVVRQAARKRLIAESEADRRVDRAREIVAGG